MKWTKKRESDFFLLKSEKKVESVACAFKQGTWLQLLLEHKTTKAKFSEMEGIGIFKRILFNTVKQIKYINENIKREYKWEIE